MPNYLDVTNWARRDLFHFFVNFDNPYFNICAHLDITKLLASLRRHPAVSVSLALHYIALRAANDIEPFRYRLRQGKVLVHDVIHGGTIVLLPNESFNFAYFNYCEDFEKFIAEASQSVNGIKTGEQPFNADPSDDRIHFTVFPWAAFTSFAHARNWGREDSVPKVAFGKFTTEQDKTLLPISVEVHHALMDGLHVGRYVSKMEALLAEPDEYLRFQQ